MNRSGFVNWNMGALLLLLTACAAEFSETSNAEMKPLTFSLVEATAEVGQAATRANQVIETAGAQMGVFLKKSVPDYPADIINRPYVYQSSSGWQPVGGDANTIWLKSSMASMVACYPYSASLSLVAGQVGVVNLTAAERNAVTPQDLWYKPFSANHGTGDLSLTLLQAYCRLRVIFVLADGYTVEPYLYRLAISGGRSNGTSTTDGIFADATLNLFAEGAYTRGTRDYTPLDVNASASARLVKKTEADTQAQFDLLMIPAALTDKVSLSTIVGGTNYGTDTKPMPLDIPASAFGNGTPDQGKLVAGNVYTLKVTVNSKALNFTKVDAQPWEDATVSGSFDVE